MKKAPKNACGSTKRRAIIIDSSPPARTKQRSMRATFIRVESLICGKKPTVFTAGFLVVT